MNGPILEPDLPIIDPHHHLWDRRQRVAEMRAPLHAFEKTIQLTPLYLLDQLLADLNTGHNIIATVHVQCGAFYRASGPEALRPVGETEFINGVAAMSASGLYGPVRACAGMVGFADLRLGDGVDAVLDAHIAAGGGRFRGVRHMMAHDEDPTVLGPLAAMPAGLAGDSAVRAAVRRLGARGLSLDAWVLEPQLPEIADLARACPGAAIVLNHAGTPLGVGNHAGKRDERFPIWRDSIRQIAALPNVHVKLGGLAMPFPGFADLGPGKQPSSQQLAGLWRPWIETCIEAFGPQRCMFESNFPVDRWGASYPTLWNAFKRITAGASATEKQALYAGAAMAFYRLDISG
ncbi:amidohydrolase [Camelimonas fluminis]|uniref:Amidohydrolase family protein n=1 Tax=Camelimonas fluminis TaxID=1576911 RepID=A0ABV7UDJ9_9HYPH|nr:amidohydrolase family protein [Camelimonas fluminis]GHE48124.1 amidohydrolase [Camelimonas fluminis]